MNIIKGLGRIASTILVAAAVVLAVALVGVRLIGFEVYTVLSGSMEPTYHTGSVIWVKECEPEEVEVGDPITFVMNEDLVVATHRVIEIDAENQHFYTQGDANDAPDAAPVHFENLIGKPVFTVPELGYFVSYIQHPPGCYIALVVCAAILILMFLPDLFAKDDEEEDEKPAREKSKRRKKAFDAKNPPEAGEVVVAQGVSPLGDCRGVPRGEGSSREGPAQTDRSVRLAGETSGRAENESRSTREVRERTYDEEVPQRVGRHGIHANQTTVPQTTRAVPGAGESAIKAPRHARAGTATQTNNPRQRVRTDAAPGINKQQDEEI